MKKDRNLFQNGTLNWLDSEKEFAAVKKGRRLRLQEYDKIR